MSSKGRAQQPGPTTTATTSPPLTPQQRYQLDLQSDGFVADAAQAMAVGKIQRLYRQLCSPPPSPGLFGWWGRRARAPAARGLYLWGGVGRGKTYLMDCFYESLPRHDKRRVHFHRFMEDVHDRLRSLATVENPLDVIGDDLAAEAKVLCFDEFSVSDIADAMIMSGLLNRLFRNRVTLVTTSNVRPDGLYRDGLQRAKFLPAIELLQRHTEVVNVDGGTDYRLRILERADTYCTSLEDSTSGKLRASFEQLAPGGWREGATIQVNHRALESIAVADGVGWFDFVQICQEPRAPADYIELARRFNTVLLSNVPMMDDETNDAARRFVHFIDEMYDRNVNLIVSAAAVADELYSGQRLAFEFRRTISRLNEMQSQTYLGREHRP